MTRGKYSIAQYGRKPNATYALFGEGPAVLAHGKDYRAPMARADELEEGESK